MAQAGKILWWCLEKDGSAAMNINSDGSGMRSRHNELGMLGTITVRA
jgi:hypothetical protein